MDNLDVINQNEYYETIRAYDYVILYGAGSKARQCTGILERFGVDISDVCDSSQDRWGEMFGNHRIRSFEEVHSE